MGVGGGSRGVWGGRWGWVVELGDGRGWGELRGGGGWEGMVVGRG